MAAPPPAPPISPELLRALDDRATGAVAGLLAGEPGFRALAAGELRRVVARDLEDAEKLRAGIEKAICRGVLPRHRPAPTYEDIDVALKSADEVAEEIMARIPRDDGCVVVLVGLSGTGKGTTVAKLRRRLPRAATWSNGNCFRALALLARAHCEREGRGEFDPGCLTAANIASWAGMVRPRFFDGVFDLQIAGLGVEARVSEIAATRLMEPALAEILPAVAAETQGEVVALARSAVEQMRDAGCTVLLEGREQTLNFIPSQHRFRLVMSDASAIGARKAAQRVAADALRHLEQGHGALASLRLSLAELAGGEGEAPRAAL